MAPDCGRQVQVGSQAPPWNGVPALVQPSRQRRGRSNGMIRSPLPRLGIDVKLKQAGLFCGEGSSSGSGSQPVLSIPDESLSPLATPDWSHKYHTESWHELIPLKFRGHQFQNQKKKSSLARPSAVSCFECRHCTFCTLFCIVFLSKF